MATINTPDDFRRSNLPGEDFNRYIIPAEFFIRIMKGEFLGKSGWGNFQADYFEGGETGSTPKDLYYVCFKDNFIVKEEINIIGDDGDFEVRIDINGGIFLHNITISGVSFNSGFKIGNGTFKEILIYHSKFLYVNSFEGGQFEGKVEIKNSEFEYLSFDGGEYNFGVTLDDFKGTQILCICGGSYKESFHIYQSECEIIEITQRNIPKGVCLISGTDIKGNLSISNASLEKIEIDAFSRPERNLINRLTLNEIIETSIIVKYAIINTLLFQNTSINNKSIINIENCNVDSIEFQSCYNYGKLNCNNLNSIGSKNGDLKILNSDLGKTQFISCDFSQAKEFTFISSKITEIFLAGTQFPREITNYGIRNAHPGHYQEQRKLGYGQLKKVYESRGDMVEARYYYKMEMIAYRASLNVNYLSITSVFHFNEWRSKDFINKFKEDIYSIPERFLLWLNRWSNNYSTSWIMGIVFTIIITHIFFGLYAGSLGYHFQFNQVGYQNYYKIFQFFSITANFDLLDGVPNFWTYLSSLVGRLFIAFGIYQTIAAFRKHGRSGA